MRLEFAEKVEFALRDLPPEEEKSVRSALEILEREDPQRIRETCPRLSSDDGPEQLLLITVTASLRAIFKYQQDDTVVVVEDLVSHAVLERFFKRVYS